MSKDADHKLDNLTDLWMPAIGIVPPDKHITCGVCGDVMRERRDIFGPTGMIESMAGNGHRHDTFTCPNRGEVWHDQVRALHSQIRDTPSVLIADMLLQEVAEVLRTRTPTKEQFSRYRF